MKNSKAKGNNFERQVAKRLSKLLGKEFTRVPCSGGLRWNNQEGIFGDIVTPEEFPFIIECKNRENWSFDQLMKKECKEFDKWCEQVVNDCTRYYELFKVEKEPLIIFTKNRLPIFVAQLNRTENNVEVEDKLIYITYPFLCYTNVYGCWYISKMKEVAFD